MDEDGPIGEDGEHPEHRSTPGRRRVDALADGISDEIRADLHAARVRIDDTAAALLHRIITGRHEDRLASTLNDKERKSPRT